MFFKVQKQIRGFGSNCTWSSSRHHHHHHHLHHHHHHHLHHHHLDQYHQLLSMQLLLRRFIVPRSGKCRYLETERNSRRTQNQQSIYLSLIFFKFMWKYDYNFLWLLIETGTGTQKSTINWFHVELFKYWIFKSIWYISSHSPHCLPNVRQIVVSFFIIIVGMTIFTKSSLLLAFIFC